VTTPTTMTCRTLVELLTDYLEGALPDDERALLEAHLAGCEACTRYLAQVRTTIRLTGMLREADLAPDAREALVGVYRAWRRG
jgi:anti-sigma factor RsiW